MIQALKVKRGYLIYNIKYCFKERKNYEQPKI